MTEEEWLTSSEPERMLRFVDVRGRKLRLFACACCRQVWNPFVPPFVIRVVTAAEAAADGEIGEGVLSEYVTLPARRAAEVSEGGVSNYVGNVTLAGYYACHGQSVAWAERATRACALAAADLPASASERERQGTPEFLAERAEQAHLLRDIFGNPFQSFELKPEWLTSDVLTLARGMYESRNFAAMPILADALQDAGCDEEELLRHCREEREHVRGCWAVDLLLGKQ